MKANHPLILIVCLVTAGGAEAADFMFRASVEGRQVEGKPLVWSDSSMTLLCRDGSIQEFAPQLALDAEKTAPSFRPYTMAEMRASLYSEFDASAFDFSSTGGYLVVHPKGEQSAWPRRFEELSRRFANYFRVRGFDAPAPPYPLVAVVYHNREGYRRALAAQGATLAPGVLGHYDRESNRVFLYDLTAGRGDVDWSHNAKTIIHEAVHQAAFNAGLHSRLSENPRWVVEGLAMMFEARGLHDPRSYDRLEDRTNQERLRDFRRRVAARQQRSLAAYVASDNAFRGDMVGAYAEAWALSFYLCESRPQEYCRYLTDMARRPAFSDYPSAERVAAFRAAFGDDLAVLEANYLAWIAELR